MANTPPLPPHTYLKKIRGDLFLASFRSLNLSDLIVTRFLTRRGISNHYLNLSYPEIGLNVIIRNNINFDQNWGGGGGEERQEKKENHEKF